MAQSPISTDSNTTKLEIIPAGAGYPLTDTPCPVDKREFARVKNGPTVNIYTGKRPNHALIAPNFPALLLALFAPALSAALSKVRDSFTHAVMLDHLDADATTWFVRLARTNFSCFTITSLATWSTNELFTRLHAILVLGHRSFAALQILRAAKSAVLSGNTPAAVSTWLFGPFRTALQRRAPQQPRAVRYFALSLAEPVVDAVLSGMLRRPLERSIDAQWWRDAVRRILASRNTPLLRRYFEDCDPLNHFQMCFIYQFSRQLDRVRETVAHGLLWSIRHGLLVDIDHVRTRHRYPEITARMKRLERWWRFMGWLDGTQPTASNEVHRGKHLDPVYHWFCWQVEEFEKEDRFHKTFGKEYGSTRDGPHCGPLGEPRWPLPKRQKRPVQEAPHDPDPPPAVLDQPGLEVNASPTFDGTAESRISEVVESVESVELSFPLPQPRFNRRTKSLPA